MTSSEARKTWILTVTGRARNALLDRPFANGGWMHEAVSLSYTTKHIFSEVHHKEPQ
jgi:hypothetical protein